MESNQSGKVDSSSPLPVTLLTGFLGAGKTTLVNRILSERHGERIAVVVNEYGELGIDGSLVVSSADELVQLANGCVCCTVRGDLQQSLIQLLDARTRRFRKKPFDRILIEASGLAAPGPIAQTLAIDPALRAALRLDGILTLAHAVNLPRQLVEHPEAAQQVAYADRLLINHADRASEEQLAACRASAARHNSLAEVLVASHAQLAVGPLLNVGTTRDTYWDLEARDLDQPASALSSLPSEHKHDNEGKHGTLGEHGHDAHVSSIALRSDQELELPKLKIWLQFLTNRRSHDLYRVKGILRCTGIPNRVIVQGMYEWLELGPGEGARPEQSALVLIGKDLDREEIERGWAACHG